MKNPLVSVIVPTRNSEKSLDKCLMSIKNQIFKDIELIVVDNNSSDNTKKIAGRYTNKVYNHGPERSAQRNYGAKKAKGMYLLFIDSDMYVNEKVVEECVGLAKASDKIAITIPEESIGIGFWAKVKAYEKRLYSNNPLIEAPRFFDKHLFLEIKGYDEGLNAFEDWDLKNRVVQKGYNISRSNYVIQHDEGNLTLSSSINKKRYYLKWIKIYKRKYPEISKRQFDILQRYPIGKICLSIIKHPILLLGLIILKSCEFNSTQE